MKIFKYFLFFLLVYSFSACKENNLVGPCVHEYKEPILNVTAVYDSINNTSVSFVTIKQLKINGHLQNTALILSNSYSVVANDSVYYCNVPFGFGTEEGTYEFIIEANGQFQKNIKIENVSYSIFKGGCPSYNDGGKRIKIIIN
jgi:hypothetical protein